MGGCLGRGHGAYVFWSHGSDGRHHVDDGDERGPDDGPDVDGQARPAEMEWSAFKLAVAHLADDGDAVGPVESDGCQIEDCSYGGVGAQTDQVDEHT